MLQDELLHCDRIDDLLSVMLLRCQPPPASIPELLTKCKWMADLLQSQLAEPLMGLLQGVAGMLHDGSLQLLIVQQVFGG